MLPPGKRRVGGRMRFDATSIAGLWLLRQDSAADQRGSFSRLFCAESFAAHGLCTAVAQTSLSVTRRAGTLRGLHFQRPPHAEAKLVCCLRGALFDVVADLRAGSATYRRWAAFELSAGDGQALAIPPGCAHGFLTLRGNTQVLYQMSHAYAPSDADGIRYDDPALGVVWPRQPSVVAARDLAWPLLGPP